MQPGDTNGSGFRTSQPLVQLVQFGDDGGDGGTNLEALFVQLRLDHPCLSRMKMIGRGTP